MARFRNRTSAGRALAEHLRGWAEVPKTIVLALSRGGLPVAFEVAADIDKPLDVFLVRRIPVPGRPDLTLGWVATGGARMVDPELQDELGFGLQEIASFTEGAMLELHEDERAMRGDQPPPDVTDRVVLLIDDAVHDVDTWRAAIQALRFERAKQVVVAVPVATREAYEALREETEDVICLEKVDVQHQVTGAYDELGEVSGEDARVLLERAPGLREPQGRLAVKPLTGTADDYDTLIERARDADFVLLGEASHGTHEFYRERAAITRRLLDEAGFTVVAVEADWPDAYRVNRYVRGVGTDTSADEALGDFGRFPTWMWRNTEVAEFVEWLRERNEGVADRREHAGFYGLDLYSLRRSMEEVVRVLETLDPDAAMRAAERYACFDHFGPDPQVYAYEAGIAGAEPCERQALEQFLELQHLAEDTARRDDDPEEDALFYAEQNARLVLNAEEYYRAMFRSGVVSWNLRDRHMAETVDALVGHLQRQGLPARTVVWAHNSHLGDARATELGEAGELNVGQLIRTDHPRRALIVGFSTYTGVVTAASDWGGEAERKRVRRALPGSWEERLHEQEHDAFLVDTAGMDGRRLERAIGVIYRPETERQSHYFHARITDQFDAIIHIDETTALEPLEVVPAWEAELPETYPFGV